jgi:PEP-CTERM motif-containing protein
MKKSSLLLGLVILLGSPLSARADPIRVLYFDRIALGVVHPTDGQILFEQDADRVFQEDSDVDRGTAAASITATTANGTLSASATLTSQFSASERAFSGTGTAFNSVSPETAGLAQGSTEFFTDFTLTELQRFTIDGLFRTTGPNTFWGIDISGDEARFRLQLRGNDTRAVSTSGLLLPGRYFMQVLTLGANSSTDFRPARVDHSFRVAFADPQVTPTPEPASLLLLGTGVAALFARHSRK